MNASENPTNKRRVKQPDPQSAGKAPGISGASLGPVGWLMRAPSPTVSSLDSLHMFAEAGQQDHRWSQFSPSYLSRIRLTYSRKGGEPTTHHDTENSLSVSGHITVNRSLSIGLKAARTSAHLG